MALSKIKGRYFRKVCQNKCVLLLKRSLPVGHYDRSLENSVKEKRETEVRGRGAIHIRQRRVSFGQKGCFVSKKVVQLFKVGKIKNRELNSGSIPEWNLE